MVYDRTERVSFNIADDEWRKPNDGLTIDEAIKFAFKRAYIPFREVRDGGEDFHITTDVIGNIVTVRVWSEG